MYIMFIHLHKFDSYYLIFSLWKNAEKMAGTRCGAVHNLLFDPVKLPPCKLRVEKIYIHILRKSNKKIARGSYILYGHFCAQELLLLLYYLEPNWRTDLAPNR